MQTKTELPKLTTAQIKPGDVLIREADHLGRPDHRVTVRAIKSRSPRILELAGYWRSDETVKALCAQNYRIVERAGARIGTFFVKYW